jgi:hypothetical protein
MIPPLTDEQIRETAIEIGRELGEHRTHEPIAITAPAPEDARARRLEIAIERERNTREARRRIDAEERGPVTLPTLTTLRAWLAQPDPEITWRVHDWQPAESRVILAAPAKSGKTTARDTLVRALADGDLWLGRYPVRAVSGTIAILDTEMSRRQLRAWLRDQRIQHADRVLVVALRGAAASLDLLDLEIRAQWVAALRAADVRYLVLDCLRPVLDALGLDEHRDAGRYLVALDALLTEAEIPEALIVHHMGHAGERSRGDSRLRDWPDVEWRIVRQDDDPASPRYITAYGRDVDVPEAQLAYDEQTRRLTIAGGSRRDAKQRAALDAIVAVLDGSADALSGRAIEAALEDSEHARADVRAALRLGSRTGTLSVTEGPRRSKLYSPVSQCATVRQQCASAPASECAAPFIGGRTRALDAAAEDRADDGALVEGADDGYHV